MTNIAEHKRLNDDELEAVAGGVAPPTIDPQALAGLMHSTVSSAVAGGGAYLVDTHTPVHTDSPSPLVTEQTHNMAPAHASIGSSSAPPTIQLPPAQSEPIAISGQVTIVGNLNIDVPSDVNSHATVEVMDLSKTPPTFTRVDPNVTAMDSGGGAPNTTNPYTVAYNTNFKPPN